MKRSILSICFVCALILCGCTANHDKQIAAIQSWEQTHSQIAINPLAADSIINLYIQFADDFPKDSLSPVYLQKAADVAVNLGKCDTAIACIDRIIDSYPEFEDLAGCYFLKGLAYEGSEQYDLAKEAYSYFVETYPDHELAADTKKMIPFLGLSDEAMLEMILANAEAEGAAILAEEI